MPVHKGINSQGRIIPAFMAKSTASFEIWTEMQMHYIYIKYIQLTYLNGYHDCE